jgi:hypothetical protein
MPSNPYRKPRIIDSFSAGAVFGRPGDTVCEGTSPFADAHVTVGQGSCPRHAAEVTVGQGSKPPLPVHQTLVGQGSKVRIVLQVVGQGSKVTSC